MDADYGEGAAAAVLPAPHALRNMMDMPEALITILLEHMFRSDLTHSDRAAMQCVNRSLCRLCRALGSFHLLQPSRENLFTTLQRVASNTLIDGPKLQGNAVDHLFLGAEDPMSGQQPLCIALGGIAIAPAASSIRTLHIDTSTGLSELQLCRRLPGSALGSLWGLRSLQALKIDSLHPCDDLDEALHHLTRLTSLDIKVELPIVPEWCADIYTRIFDWWEGGCGCGFPTSLVKCTSLRHLSFCAEEPGLFWFSDVPAEFGNLTALETVSLVGCQVASLPATITCLTRCNARRALNSLTFENTDYCDIEDVELPEGFCSAMQSLQYVAITHGGEYKQLVYEGGKQTVGHESH